MRDCRISATRTTLRRFSRADRLVTADHHGNPGAGGSVASEETGARNLGRRVMSALVLAPVALGAAYLGGWAFTLVSLVAAAAILREWASLATHRPDPRVFAPSCFCSRQCGPPTFWPISSAGRSAARCYGRV